MRHLFWCLSIQKIIDNRIYMGDYEQHKRLNIESVIINKDEHGKLFVDKITFRKKFLTMLSKLYNKGIMDVVVPVNIENKEQYLKGTPNIKEEVLKDYINRTREFVDTNYYELENIIEEKLLKIKKKYTLK